MRSLWGIALGAIVLTTSACKIARTPEEYIDHREPVSVQREAAVAELNDRLLAAGQALSRANAAEALIALPPAPGAYVVTPADAEPLKGEAEISEALERLLVGSVPVRVSEVQVSAGPRATTAWFRARVELGEDRATLRVTGLFVRGDEGVWQLAQAHLSHPTPPAPNPAEAAAPPAGE